jgi:SMC interacting uncharacterized protein involved in chromosome segregation
MTEFYKSTKSDLEDSMDKLHQANRVRHELEIRLHAELESSYRLKKTIDEKSSYISETNVRLEYYEMQRRADFQAQ